MNFITVSYSGRLKYACRRVFEPLEAAIGLRSPSALWRKWDQYRTLAPDPLWVFPPCFTPQCRQWSQQKGSSPFPRGAVGSPQPSGEMRWEKRQLLLVPVHNSRSHPRGWRGSGPCCHLFLPGPCARSRRGVLPHPSLTFPQCSWVTHTLLHFSGSFWWCFSRPSHSGYPQTR